MSPPPSPLTQCVVGGKLNTMRYVQYQAVFSLRQARICLRKRLLRRHSSSSLVDHNVDINEQEPKNNIIVIGPKQCAQRCV